MRTARTEQEIVERWQKIESDDVFGFRREVLATVLPVEALQRLLPGTAAEDLGGSEWDRVTVRNRETTGQLLTEYYAFAVNKIDAHRGISASRSVEKLTEYCWLIGRDDVVQAMQDTSYAPYGAPILARMASLLDLSWPTDERMTRMAGGLPCVDDCEGCGI